MTELLEQTGAFRPNFLSDADELSSETPPSNEIDSPEVDLAYSQESPSGQPFKHFDAKSPEEKDEHLSVLSRDEFGEVFYDPNSGEIVRHRTLSGDTIIVPQEITHSNSELPQEIAQAIDQAPTFEDAVAILHSNKNPDPLVQVATLEAIANKFHDPNLTGKIDRLIVDTVKNASDTDTSPEVVIGSMIHAVDIASPDAKSTVIDTLKDTLDTAESISPEVVDAVHQAIDDFPEIDINTGSFRTLVEECSERNQLIDERRLLLDKLAALDQQIDAVNASIELQTRTKRRLPGVRGLLSGLVGRH